MSDSIVQMMETLGMEGIQAFYVYMFLDYGSLWIFFALCTWGARSAWKVVKKDLT